MEILIELTKKRAYFLLEELQVYEFDAKIVEETENWAMVKVAGSDDFENIIAFAFNSGVSYGRKNETN